MAPELFQEEAPFSAASDIWALGCMLYECAAGHPPFLSSSFQELVQAIMAQQPPPLKGGIGHGHVSQVMAAADVTLH